MRIASRVIGVVLVIAGVAFFALAVLSGAFYRASVLAPRTGIAWMATALFAAFGVALLLAGWYFLRLDPEEPEGAGRSDRFFASLIPYRRELKIAAQFGLVISVAELVALTFDVKLARGVVAPLSWTSLALALIAAQISEGHTLDQLDWDRVPEQTRPILRILWQTSFCVLWLFGFYLAWSRWRHQTRSAAIVAIVPVICFFWAAMSFAFGRVREAGELL